MSFTQSVVRLAIPTLYEYLTNNAMYTLEDIGIVIVGDDLQIDSLARRVTYRRDYICKHPGVVINDIVAMYGVFDRSMTWLIRRRKQGKSFTLVEWQYKPTEQLWNSFLNAAPFLAGLSVNLADFYTPLDKNIGVFIKKIQKLNAIFVRFWSLPDALRPLPLPISAAILEHL